MTISARDYTRTTLRRLDTLSGNQCAAPCCDKPLIARDGQTIVSKICHIEAASPDGPRYNPQMTDEDRRHYNNLVLLCDECHSIIDNKNNSSTYTVELLRSWKKNHERKNLARQAANASSLALAINAITEMSFSEELPLNNDITQSFKIQEKIEFNAITRNLPLLEEYKVFNSKIDALYDELENQGSFKKDKLLRIIKHTYTKAKGKYIGAEKDFMPIIRLNADNIIEDVESSLIDIADKNTPNPAEDISFAVSLIMVDAFMRCKILEEPRSP